MVRFDGGPVTAETLAPMVAAMSFWGPDGHGQWCGESVGLGHLMLHVTPESLQERLPASIRVAPHLVITADARIDNRDDLFDALGAPAHGREQTPDSSLILLAYERWGPDCLKRLLGDFAFAIWDNRERRLFCARDPFGCMPFVYHHDGKRFVFASDIKGVLARVESPRLNEPLLAAYLQQRTHNAEKRVTFFEEIVKLPPAHSLTLTTGGVQISQYWSPRNAPEIRLSSDADFTDQMRHLFQQSVECRLRSAFPIGSHLSGGLDSSAVSIVAARATRQHGRPLEVFSWAPPPEPGARYHGADEYLRIEAVCSQESLTCHYVPSTYESFIETFKRDITVEPIIMMPREENVQVSAEAMQLRVMLSGWGGDEAVSAYNGAYLAHLLLNHNWAELRNTVGLRLAAAAGAQHAPFQKALRSARSLGGALRELAYPLAPDTLYSLTPRGNFPKYRTPCIQAGFRDLYRSEVKDLRGPVLRVRPNFRRTICDHLEYGHITARIEDWTESGARHRLVYRYPLLDRRLIDFVIGTPATELYGPAVRRSTFRRAVGGLLPASADWMTAKKEPFAIAALTRDYIRSHQDWSGHLISDAAGSPANRFVDPGKIQKAMQAGSNSDSMLPWLGVREALFCYAIKYPGLRMSPITQMG